MNYIAKKQNQEQAASEYYELFTTETTQDVNGNEVVIPRSIGHYSVAQLESEKASYQNQIAEIDNKISAIEALQ